MDVPDVRSLLDPGNPVVNLMENAWKYVHPEQFPNVEVGTTEGGVRFS